MAKALGSAILFLILAVVLLSPSMGAPDAGKCSREEHVKAEKEYASCQEAAHKKLRDGEIDACSYLEDFVHRCGDGLAECMSEKAVEQVRESSVRVAYRTLSVERAFDFGGCGILARYGVDTNEEEPLEEVDQEQEDEDEEEKVDGVCTPKELQRAYKK